jgi:Flp pilus assembly protein TadD
VRGNVKRNIGDLVGAIDDFTKVIELDPKNSQAYYYRGLAFFDLNKMNEAELDFIKASELGDKNASELVEIIMKYPKKTE